MVLLEATVHSSLRAFLREQGRFYWPHHLTMGRLVARALRLKRSSLIQTGTTLTRYCLSYLTPALL
ncbi:MAG: ATP-dependent DNA helicase, partial [Microcystis aeruginosa]